MSSAQYDPDWGQYDGPGPDDDLAVWEQAAERTRAARRERMAAGWNPGGRPPSARRTLTGAEALRQLGEQKDTAPTAVMRKIQAEVEARAYMESEGQRALDWLGSHAAGNTGP